MAHPQPQGHPDSAADLRGTLEHAKKFEQAENFEDAIELLKPWVTGKNPDPDACYRMASVRLKQGLLPAAERHLKQALEGRYEDARFHTNLGVVFDLQGKSDEAIRCFRRAIQLAPHETTAHLNLGALYGELGRYDDAARSLQHCLRIAPGFDAHFNLALVFFRQGKLVEAEIELEQALDHDDEAGLAHYYLGQCRFKRGLTADAVRSFQTALRCQPSLVRARFYLGMAMNKLGRYGAAVSELQKVAQVLADDGRVHYQLGIAHDGLGQKAEARECFRRARTLAG